MGRTALIPVDLINDFFENGALPVLGAREIIGVSNTVLKRGEQKKYVLVLPRDYHPADSDHFILYNPHGIPGTWGAEFHPDIEIPPDAVIVYKGTEAHGDMRRVHGYSGFDGQTADGRTLDEVLRAFDVDTVIIWGLATTHCVKATVLDALRLGYRVCVILDGIRGLANDVTDTSFEGIRDGSLAAIKEMQNAGAEFIISYLGEDVKIRVGE